MNLYKKEIYIVLFSCFLFLILFFLVKDFLKKIWILKIGRKGEENIHNILKTLPKNKYHVISNVLLKHRNGKTSQIDHVVVSRKGIFVIETKNYSGVVFGDVRNKYWSHISGRNKHPVFNIILQNEGHVKAVKYIFYEILSKKLSARKYKKFFVSVILFCNDKCNIKIKKPIFFFKFKYKVCNQNNVLSIIKKTKKRNRISKKTYKELISVMNEKNISSSKNMRHHVRRVKHFFK